MAQLITTDPIAILHDCTSMTHTTELGLMVGTESEVSQTYQFPAFKRPTIYWGRQRLQK